jgi:hypothetical protein
MKLNSMLITFLFNTFYYCLYFVACFFTFVYKNFTYYGFRRNVRNAKGLRGQNKLGNAAVNRSWDTAITASILTLFSFLFIAIYQFIRL